VHAAKVQLLILTNVSYILIFSSSQKQYTLIIKILHF